MQNTSVGHNPLVNLVREVVSPSNAALENTTVSFILHVAVRLRQLLNLVPPLILTIVGEAGYHASDDHCPVAFLKRAECREKIHI